MLTPKLRRKIHHIEIRSRRLVADTLAGDYHTHFKGRGIAFSEVRPYQPGDDVRVIDWNVTARMQAPYIKRFSEERQRTMLLLVDISGSTLFGSQTFEGRPQQKRDLAAELAAVLAFAATANNDNVGLVTFSDRTETLLPPRKGRAHILRLVRTLLTADPPAGAPI